MLTFLFVQLAMITLGTLFGGGYLMTRGGKKETATPPINAASSDEADFIKCATAPKSPGNDMRLTIP